MKVCPKCGTNYAEDINFCSTDGSPLEDASNSDPLVGRVIDDRYRLQALIGSGSFGLVYRATHERMPRQLAVKILSEEMSADPQWVARFEREVRAQALLDHPNIIEVYDYGMAEGIGYYIAMEFLRGEDLASRLERERSLPIVEVYKIIFEAGSALAAAHAADIVHRDVKPENVFLAERSSDEGGYSVRLLDFGIAKVVRPRAELPDLGELTGVGSAYIAGSPYTMSPEQVRCEPVDSRSDIYSLGCVLYELLTGNVPFYGESAQELWDKHTKEEAAAPSRVEGSSWIMPDLDEIVLWMLAKDPGDRPPLVEEIIDALEYIRPRVEEVWALHHLIPRPDGHHGTLTRAFAKERKALAKTTRLFGDTMLDSDTLPARLSKLEISTFFKDRTPRILLVDDERLIRSLVRRMLEKKGYDPVLMESGEKALRWLRKNLDVDAILLDLIMPGLDGFTVMKMARAQGYHGPIIICSGLSTPVIREEALRQGAIEYLNKGEDLHHIPAVLDRIQEAAQIYHESKRTKFGGVRPKDDTEELVDIDFSDPLPDPFSD